MEAIRLFQLLQELHASKRRWLLSALILEVPDFVDYFLDLLVNSLVFLRLRFAIIMAVGQRLLRFEGHLGEVVHHLRYHWHLDSYLSVRLPFLNCRQCL